MYSNSISIIQHFFWNPVNITRDNRMRPAAHNPLNFLVIRANVKKGATKSHNKARNPKPKCYWGVSIGLVVDIHNSLRRYGVRKSKWSIPMRGYCWVWDFPMPLFPRYHLNDTPRLKIGGREASVDHINRTGSS